MRFSRPVEQGQRISKRESQKGKGCRGRLVVCRMSALRSPRLAGRRVRPLAGQAVPEVAVLLGVERVHLNRVAKAQVLLRLRLELRPVHWRAAAAVRVAVRRHARDNAFSYKRSTNNEMVLGSLSITAV